MTQHPDSESGASWVHYLRGNVSIASDVYWIL